MKQKENILTNIPKHNYIESATETNKEDFINVINSRRSVRVFTDEPVSPNHLIECLELALLAPTSSNLQCWEFYWVKDKNNKDALIKFVTNCGLLLNFTKLFADGNNLLVINSLPSLLIVAEASQLSVGLSKCSFTKG